MVRAVNAKGEGQFSSSSAPEHPLRQPDAPAAPVGQRGDKFINVSWTPPGNGGDPIIDYEVQLLSTGAVATATGTSLRWSNLPNGQAQQFQVRARNRGGWGPFSAASAPVIPCGVPDAPGSVSAERGDTAATVAWAAPYDQGCAITGYTVTASSGASVNVGGGQTSMTFGGLQQRHQLHVHRRRPQRGRRRRPQRRLQRRRPGRPARRAAVHLGHAGHPPGDGSVERRQPQRLADHHLPAVRRRRRLGERRDRHGDDPRRSRQQHDVQLPGPRRQRRRPGPGPAARRPGTHTRRARAGRWPQRRRAATGGSARAGRRPNDNGKPITHYGSDRNLGRHVLDRPGERPLARPGAVSRRHPVRGPRPGLQRDRLRSVERHRSATTDAAAAADAR